LFEDARPMVALFFALVIFLLFELFIILFTESKGESLSSRQSINILLGFKVGKIFLSLLIVAVYAAVVKVELIRFVGVFLGIYLIYLLFDTLYLLNREKSLKTKQFKLKEIENLNNYYKDK